MPCYNAATYSVGRRLESSIALYLAHHVRSRASLCLGGSARSQELSCPMMITIMQSYGGVVTWFNLPVGSTWLVSQLII
jgi:hypothetical protein